jgi:hypothetical protein
MAGSSPPLMIPSICPVDAAYARAPRRLWYDVPDSSFVKTGGVTLESFSSRAVRTCQSGRTTRSDRDDPAAHPPSKVRGLYGSRN